MDPLELLRKELDAQRRAEDMARERRVYLEQLIRKIEGGEAKERTAPRKRKFYREQITAWAVDVLSDGMPRPLKEIIQGISERANDAVPESTVRSVLSSDENFVRVETGIYALAQKPMTEDDVPF